MESACAVHGKYIVKTIKIIHDAERHEGHGSSLSVCSKGWRLEELFTDQVMLHRKDLVSSLAVFVQENV